MLLKEETKGKYLHGPGTCMVWEYYVAVLPVNHIITFCMRLYVNGGSHIKYTYMIDREHSHMVLSNHANIFRT